MFIPNFQWSQDAPARLDTAHPDTLPRLPGSISVRITMDDMQMITTVLQRILPEANSAVWLPARTYNSTPVNPRLGSLLPAHHRDLRSMSWLCPEANHLFTNADVLYEALVRLHAEQWIDIEATDNGLVVKRRGQRNLIEIENDASSERSGSNTSDSTRSASSTRPAPRGPQKGSGFQNRGGRRGRGRGYGFRFGDTTLPARAPAPATAASAAFPARDL